MRFNATGNDWWSLMFRVTEWWSVTYIDVVSRHIPTFEDKHFQLKHSIVVFQISIYLFCPKGDKLRIPICIISV